MPFARLATTGLNVSDQSAHAHQATPETLLPLASEANVSRTVNVKIIALALTINAQIHASESAEPTQSASPRDTLLSAPAQLEPLVMPSSSVVSPRASLLPDTTDHWRSS
jgi:hypothetical protein